MYVTLKLEMFTVSVRNTGCKRKLEAQGPFIAHLHDNQQQTVQSEKKTTRMTGFK